MYPYNVISVNEKQVEKLLSSIIYHGDIGRTLLQAKLSII